MSIHPSRFEQVTAVTDLALGLVAGGAAFQLSARADFKSQVWAWAFGLLAFASFLGVVAHGFAMSKKQMTGYGCR